VHKRSGGISATASCNRLLAQSRASLHEWFSCEQGCLTQLKKLAFWVFQEKACKNLKRPTLGFIRVFKFLLLFIMQFSKRNI